LLLYKPQKTGVYQRKFAEKVVWVEGCGRGGGVNALEHDLHLFDHDVVYHAHGHIRKRRIGQPPLVEINSAHLS
jgi:hypothetical protein